MKRTMEYLSLGVLVFALVATWTPEAEAKATCFCKISMDNMEGHTYSSGVCNDLTPTANMTFTGPFQQGLDNQQKCNNRCAEIIPPFINSQSVATACCALGAPSGTAIHAYSAVGQKQYWGVPTLIPYSATPTLIGTLTNSPAVTQAKCPAGWLGNLNVDGGVTIDGKCKKLSGTMSITPLPPNGTAIGTYGFTWGNEVWAWGTQANGGAAVITTITAAVCSF